MTTIYLIVHTWFRGYCIAVFNKEWCLHFSYRLRRILKAFCLRCACLRTYDLRPSMLLLYFALDRSPFVSSLIDSNVVITSIFMGPYKFIIFPLFVNLAARVLLFAAHTSLLLNFNQFAIWSLENWFTKLRD